MAVTERQPLMTTDRQSAPSRVADMAMNGLHTLLGLALLLVVGINFVNAVSRYLLGVSPLGADELMVYIVIWVVMVAAVLSLIMRSHINVNLLPLHTSGRTRHLLHVIHDAAAVLACGYATYASWLFIGRISRLGVTSMGLGVPMTVPHAALLAGFAGLTVAGAFMLVRDVIALVRNAPHTGRAP